MQKRLTARDIAAAYMRRRGIHYGWVMVALVFLVELFETAALGLPSVLIVPMAEELGFSIGEIAAPTGLRMAIVGLAAPLAGGLVLRYGPRRMVILSSVVTLVGLVLAIVTTQKWQLWLGLGFLLGIGPGMIGVQLPTVVGARWFTKRQGFVVGLMTGSTATGMLIFMPLGAFVSELWGWRVALAVPVSACFFSLWLYWLLAFERPEEIDLPRLGEDVVDRIPEPYTESFVAISLRALMTASKTWVFWILAFTFMVCGISSYGLTQAHLVPFCTDLGVAYASAAWLLAVIAVCDLIGTTGSGWLSDRYDNRWLLTMYYGLRGVSLIWLVSSNPSFGALTIFAVIYGLDFIATVPPTARLSVMSFGRDLGPVVFGWIFTAHHLAAGLTAVFAGISRDITGSYYASFLFAGIACLIGAVAILGLKKNEPTYA